MFELLLRPVQADAGRIGRAAEDDGDVGDEEILPTVEADDLAILRPQPGHRLIHFGVFAVCGRRGGWFAQRGDLGGKPALAVATPPVVGEHQAGNAEQPRPDGFGWGRVPLPPGNGERLCGDIFRVGGRSAPPGIGEDVAVVLIEGQTVALAIPGVRESTHVG